MKFATQECKKLFLIEIGKISMLDSIAEDWEPTEEMLEAYIQKRKELIPALRDFRRSQSAKEAWRHNKHGYLKGIRRFHKSTKGKRMHRTLGDFLATRESFLNSSPFHNGIFEALKAISSIKTHAFIELEYYQPVDEYIEFSEMVETLIPVVARVDSSLIKGSISLEKNDLEFLYRIAEEKELVGAFARKYDKPLEEVEAYWQKCKSKVEGQVSEEHEFYYTNLVEALESHFAS